MLQNLPPLKWISSSRFEEARKKRFGSGISLNIHSKLCKSLVMLPPLESKSWFIQYYYDIISVVRAMVFPNRLNNSFDDILHVAISTTLLRDLESFIQKSGLPNTEPSWLTGPGAHY